MLTHRISLSIILLYLPHIIGRTTWDLPEGQITCFDSEPSLALADCTAALPMIPAGLTFDVAKLPRQPDDHQRPITLDLDKRPRKLPALFNVASCIIVVAVRPAPSPGDRRSPARALYFKLWPTAREAAAKVIHWCVAERHAPGTIYFPYDVDGFRGHMRVEVYLRKGGKAPKGGRRQKDRMWPSEVYHTVYTPEKIAKAARGSGEMADRMRKNG